jgi:hypothetical protein
MLMSYNGPFSMRIISNMGKYLTDNVIAVELAKIRLYKVFIELTQNVALYSADRHQQLNGSPLGIGSVIIQNHTNSFRCTTINEIAEEHQNILITYCNSINTSTIQDLKVKKEKLRKESTYEDSGAHIGLIMVSLYSGNPVEVDVITNPDTNKKYFSITAIINKDKF